ncbi:unnamed protein product, partial [Arabidopsis halleri]
ELSLYIICKCVCVLCLNKCFERIQFFSCSCLLVVCFLYIRLERHVNFLLYR